jgi:hypothetical protein
VDVAELLWPAARAARPPASARQPQRPGVHAAERPLPDAAADPQVVVEPLSRVVELDRRRLLVAGDAAVRRAAGQAPPRPVCQF